MKFRNLADCAAGIIGLSLLFSTLPCFSLDTQSVSASLSVVDGLKTASFNTACGRLNVYLPADMSGGDTISGTVIAEPDGETKEERAQNTDELNGYIVEIKKAKQPARLIAQRMPKIPNYSTPAPCASPLSPIFTCSLPADSANPNINLVLHDPHGNNVCELPVDYNTHTPKPTAPPNSCAMPPITQGGHPVPISLPSDGRLDDFDATMGGVPMMPMAASPRTTFAKSPHMVPGPTDVVVTKGNKTATMHVNNVQVKLSCPKPVLQKGEHTTMNVTVSGLEGLDAPVKLTVENHTPQIVQLSGGNIQTFNIPPQQ